MDKKSNIISKNAKRLSNKQIHEQHHVLVYMRKKNKKIPVIHLCTFPVTMYNIYIAK